MIKYKKIYFDYFGYGEQDTILCEVCEDPAVDIHHIKFKSRGGKDEIENEIALCRRCHNKAHCYLLTKKELSKIHLKNL